MFLLCRHTPLFTSLIIFFFFAIDYFTPPCRYATLFSPATCLFHLMRLPYARYSFSLLPPDITPASLTPYAMSPCYTTDDDAACYVEHVVVTPLYAAFSLPPLSRRHCFSHVT